MKISQINIVNSKKVGLADVINTNLYVRRVIIYFNPNTLLKNINYIKWIPIMLFVLLISSSIFGQKGRLSLDVGTSFHSYRYHGDAYGESFDYNKYFQYGTSNSLNYTNKAEFSSHYDIVPRVELSYSIFKKVNIIAGGYGFQREIKYEALRWFGPYPGWIANYHEKAFYLGLITGTEYLIIDKDRHRLTLGLIASFDKIIQRTVYENKGQRFNTSNNESFLATDAFPHYNDFHYKLFSSITYEYIFNDNLSIKTRLRYNPPLNFVRKRKRLPEDSHLSVGQGGIFCLDILLCYQIRYKSK